MKKETKEKLFPLVAAAAVLVLDQLCKLVVLSAAGENKSVSVLGDFFRLTPFLRRFVMTGPGGGAPPFFQIAVNAALPLILLGLLVFLYFHEKRLRPGVRVPLAAVLGGGLANLCDRLVHGGGVVEFLDFKAFGIFGLSRWPAFNLADLAVLAGAIVFIVVWIVRTVGARRAGKRTPEE